MRNGFFIFAILVSVVSTAPSLYAEALNLNETGNENSSAPQLSHKVSGETVRKIWSKNLAIGLGSGFLAGEGILLLSRGGFQPSNAGFQQETLTVTILAGLLSGVAFSYFETKALKEGNFLVGPGFAQIDF